MRELHTPNALSARAYIRFGLAVIAAVFGGLVLWSVLAPINGAVIANGRVVVESSRKEIQHLEGGVVSGILVKEGERVDAGQVLIQLEASVQRANLAVIDNQLAELYARRTRLLAERDGLDAPPPPAGIEEILSNPDFEAKLAGQAQLFEARKRTQFAQVSLLNQRIAEENDRIGGLNAQIKSSRAQRGLIEDELAGVKKLYEEGFAPLTRVRALERQSKQLEGDIGSLTASIAESNSAIGGAKLEISRLESSIREDAIKELRDDEGVIAQLEEKRPAAAIAMARTEIRAPQAGRVLDLSIHTIGGVIAPGQSLMEIVPDDDNLQVEARLSPRDIDKVRAGQDAVIAFTSFSSRTTPRIKGVVKTVSADTIADRTTGVAYYRVVIELPETARLNDELNGQPLEPGMPAEAFIRTKARPAIAYFLKPLTDAVSRSMRDD